MTPSHYLNQCWLTLQPYDIKPLPEPMLTYSTAIWHQAITWTSVDLPYSYISLGHLSLKFFFVVAGGGTMPCGDVEAASGGGDTRASSGPGLVQYLLGLCAACLPSVMASTKKKHSPPPQPPHQPRKRLRRETWPAMANDETISEGIAEFNGRRRESRCRPQSATDYVQQYLALDKITTTRRKKKHFLFSLLPEDVKLKVFTFLTPMERGKAAHVCREWNRLVRDPSVWTIVDFTIFPMCPKTQTHTCGPPCYSIYKKRLKQYMSYLERVRPSLKRLCFAFDIVDPKDKWLACLEGLLNRAHCHELEEAHLNWKETPIKPFWVEGYQFPNDPYGEYMQRHRARQRRFVNFFDLFTTRAPNVRKMVLPFDWSQRSLACLGRLRRLHTLILEKYFVFQVLQQESLEQLLAGAPQLERLIMEVWTPSGRGLLLFRISSPRLRYLDVSQCRGFYLKELSAANLHVFKVARHPWNGPLTCADSLYIPCLYDVLRLGTPRLRQLNEHTLQPDWHVDTYPELEVVLKAVCSCRRHKSSWAM